MSVGLFAHFSKVLVPKLFLSRSSDDVASKFIRWSASRAFLHRGYWLIASLYLVYEAHLTPVQLVLLGTGQGMVSLVFEIPAGVFADTVSRKWALVISQVGIGLSMIATGLLTSFPLLMATQMLWGIAWTFSSGSDVAWFTDELRDGARTSRALVSRAKWEQFGALVGMVVIGGIASAFTEGVAMVSAGVAMTLLGAYVAIQFGERNFVSTTRNRWKASRSILRGGLRVAKNDKQILLMLVATFLVGGALEAYERLYPKRLEEVGLPEGTFGIVTFTLLGVATLVVGFAALRLLEGHLHRDRSYAVSYALACLVGALGLAALAITSSYVAGAVATLVVGGVAISITRTVGVVWINARVTSEVRSTVISMSAQFEYVGEIVCGVLLGVLAQSAGLSVVLFASGGVFVLVTLLVATSTVKGGIYR